MAGLHMLVYTSAVQNQAVICRMERECEAAVTGLSDYYFGDAVISEKTPVLLLGYGKLNEKECAVGWLF